MCPLTSGAHTCTESPSIMRVPASVDFRWRIAEPSWDYRPETTVSHCGTQTLFLSVTLRNCFTALAVLQLLTEHCF